MLRGDNPRFRAIHVGVFMACGPQLVPSIGADSHSLERQRNTSKDVLEGPVAELMALSVRGAKPQQRRGRRYLRAWD